MQLHITLIRKLQVQKPTRKDMTFHRDYCTIKKLLFIYITSIEKYLIQKIFEAENFHFYKTLEKICGLYNTHRNFIPLVLFTLLYMSVLLLFRCFQHKLWMSLYLLSLSFLQKTCKQSPLYMYLSSYPLSFFFTHLFQRSD